MGVVKSALLVIDVQMAFVDRDAQGTPRSTPQAESNIARLLETTRQRRGTIIHVHHHSKEDGSLFSADLPGSKVQEFATPESGEVVYIKHVNSAFIGTDLESDLRKQGIDHLVLCGATANHCVETTARMAGNLGFDVSYVADAVWAYGNTGPDGRTHGPEDLLSMSISNLDGEFATVRATDDLLA